jgi:filamentous hemagglutinin
MMYRQILSITISIFLFLSQTLSAANIEIDSNAPNRNKPYLENAPNGTTIINIVTPNIQGVSHNKFKNYNVDSKGLILNNSKTITNTQLAGYISFNKNLTGNNAKLILNEVTGTNRSLLKGFTEVAGQKADVIIANPNGITVNGGGFINTNKVTLTTGKPFVDGGLLQGFHVNTGDILIEGEGFNGNNIDQVNLYTKALQLNAKLYANKLSVVTGKNDIALDGTVTNEKSFDSGISIDSSLLGGIYANTISLVSNDKGVGVNLPPEVFAQDTLAISAQGDIVLKQTLTQNSLNINTSKTLYNTQKMMANDITLNVHSIVNTDKIEAKNTLEATANNIENRGYFNSASDMTFNVNVLDNYATLFSGNDINLYVKDTLYNHTNANILALNNITIGKVEQKTLFVKNETANIETINGDITIFANLLENTTDPLVKEENLVSQEDFYSFAPKPIEWAISELKKEGKTHTKSNMLYLPFISVEVKSIKSPINPTYTNVSGYLEIGSSADELINSTLVYSKKAYEIGSTTNSFGVETKQYAFNIEYVNASDLIAKINEYSSRFGVTTQAGTGVFNNVTPSNVTVQMSYKLPLFEVARAASITVKDEAVSSTPKAATIISGGKINLNVDSTRNYLSQIAANDMFDITGTSLDNSGENLFRINTLTGTYQYCYSNCDSSYHSPDYAYAELPSKTTYEVIDHVYSSIYSAKDITGNVATVNNIDIKSNQAPLGASGSTLLLDDTLDTVSIDPITKEVKIDLPEGEYGLFIHSNDENAKYFIERNPAFTSYTNFISSDYMLSKLDFNLDETIKRLDGLYENKLIRDSIFAQSGKRYLNSDITNDQEQFTYLMDNALELQQDLQLTPTIALSKEQRDALTKDIVWMEEKIIDGQKVLVPVVYLADATSLDSSLILANGDIDLNVNKLVNTGAIKTKGSLNIDADEDILNAGGTLQADNALNLKSNTNIVNLSGTLQADKIDIKSDVFISDVATNEITKEFIAGSEKNTLVSEPSRIISDTDINIDATTGINLIGTQVKANDDVTLTSQGDVNIISKEVSNVYDDITLAGFKKESKTEQFSSTIDAKNLTVNADNITLQASNVQAQEDINLNAKNSVNIIAAANEEATDSRHDVDHDERTYKTSKITTVSSILSANNVNIDSKDTSLIASQIIANEAQITADIFNLISQKDIDYEDYYEYRKDLMTMSTTSKGHLREKVVEASVQTNKLIFNERDLSDQLQKENLVKKLSSEYNLNETQIKLVKETIRSKEWDDQTKSLTGFGQLVVMIIVTFMTAGAGTSIVGTAGAATTGTTTAATTTAATTTAATTTTATVQAAVVQSVVTGVANQLATSAITGESFKLDGESLLKGAISAGVMAYASDLIDGALEIDNVATSKMTTAEVFERSAANTVVRSGLNSVMYGTDFQDSLISGLKTDITNTGFHLAGDTALENTLEDGSLEKTLIHGVVGGGASELMGGEFAVGASSAAMNELLSPYTSIDEKERLIKGGRDREIELALSGFIGGATAYAVGGDEAVGTGEAIARSATEYNRQLHREEIKFINENAEEFAKEQGIDIYDAKARLAQQGLRQTDKAWSLVLGETDAQAQTFLQNNSNGMFSVADQHEFIDGSTNGKKELSDLTQQEFNDLRQFYQNNVWKKTSTNPEGNRELLPAYKADVEQTWGNIKNISGGQAVDIAAQSVIDLPENVVQSILDIPDTLNSFGNFLDALAPTTTQERLDILYNQGYDGSKVQANLATSDVISVETAAFGGVLAKSALKNVGNSVDESVKKSVNTNDLGLGEVKSPNPNVEIKAGQDVLLTKNDGSVNETLLGMDRPYRNENLDYPANQEVVDKMNSPEIQSCHANMDCSEKADILKNTAGSGYTIEVRNPNKDAIKIQENGSKVEYEYHTVYTDGQYVYDPTLSSQPIPKGDWEQHMKKLNDGNVEFTIQKDD